jgi:hypothetical protein
VKLLGPEEILERDRYEAVRAEYRARVIALKRDRRVGVGELVTLVFENRETLRFQVQEMLRVEGIDSADAIRAELDVYNPLMPREGELSATLFIEITESDHIKPELDRLIGIDAHVALVLGEVPGETRVYAQFDTRQLDADRISAVQYLRFRLDSLAAGLLRDPSVRARLRIDHPRYQAEAEVSGPLRAQLLADLAGREPPSLIDVPGRAISPSDECLLETGTLRVLRRSPGSTVLIECRAPVSLGEADPALLAELLPVLQRYVREIVSESGACRVRCDVAGAGAPMRWHLRAGRG